MRHTVIPQIEDAISYTILAVQGGGISIANIKNPGHFTKVCAIEIYEINSFSNTE